ncbi:hypothetical protein PS15m_005400 [Mucor circinelloides]
MDGGFIKKLNNSGQGDCGFKALAQQMYHPEDETKHNIVRSLMLETLEKNKAFYTTCFGKGIFQYEACCKILSTPHRWFTTPNAHKLLLIPLVVPLLNILLKYSKVQDAELFSHC